jgi:hypothetical protein
MGIEPIHGIVLIEILSALLQEPQTCWDKRDILAEL